MKLKEITYSESRKLTTGVRFESRLISISAQAQVQEGEDKYEIIQDLKEFVKGELAKEIQKK